MARGDSTLGVRLAVRPSGCSGLAYVIEYVDSDNLQEGDLTFESHGVTVVIDPKSMVHVNGTELDYLREGLQEGFKLITLMLKTPAVAVKVLRPKHH